MVSTSLCSAAFKVSDTVATPVPVTASLCRGVGTSLYTIIDGHQAPCRDVHLGKQSLSTPWEGRLSDVHQLGFVRIPQQRVGGETFLCSLLVSSLRAGDPGDFYLRLIILAEIGAIPSYRHYVTVNTCSLYIHCTASYHHTVSR